METHVTLNDLIIDMEQNSISRFHFFACRKKCAENTVDQAIQTLFERLKNIEVRY